MVSDINSPRPPDEARADGDRLRDAASREANSAREEARKAGDTLKNEASRLGSQAKDKAYEGAESGKNAAAGNLNDFTAAIRKASDELGERDQSMAANLVREAASGLEQVSGAIEGKSVQELTRSVAGFARRQPAAFLIGAALAGVALGRFARASSEHDEADYVGGDDHGYRSPTSSAGYGAARSGPPYGGTSGVSGAAARQPAPSTAPTSTNAAFASGPPRTETGSTPAASSAFRSTGAGGTSPLTQERTGGSSTSPAGTTSTPGTARTATTTGVTPGTTGGDNVR